MLTKSLSYCIIFFLVTGAAFAQVASLPKTVEKQVDVLFSAYNKPGSPGYAIGIFKDQKILLAKGYGMANLDYNIPIMAGTFFNIASLSEQFTAACIASLILKDSITLEDEVSKFVPAVAKYGRTIKIKHLVYFTSGIHEYHTLPHKNGLNWNLYDYFTLDTAIATSLSQPKLQFEPGTKWEYSNTDYMLLAKIVEKVSGQTMNEFATKNIFLPLGMTSTQINDDVTAIVSNRATGYVPRIAETVNGASKVGYYLRKEGDYLQAHWNSPHYGGSGVFTSINDWYRWDKNFYTHALGGQAFYELMHKRMKFSHDKNNDAFGLVFGDYKGEQIIWYAGGDIGFNSCVMRFPSQALTIVCFSNLDLSGNAEKMAMQVADILAETRLLKLSKKATRK
ncbi:MAG: class A beta-lactamase-related serine hydrolase [Sphingobacteriaceae bacterium]|nr:MAG: class A beta-lactamase-related serine hydrolase [Sphingobacteriaceae bacterium]